jgi:DeoR/GlpR family transcriptional regulator of sugar metabolism
LAASEKQRIARAALALIKPEESIYLDGGSTVLALARLLTHMTALTVVTNSLHVANALAGGGPRLILVGGELRRRSETFVGALTQPVIERLHVDQAFMGTIGLSLDEGVTTTDPNEAMTKRLVVSHAGTVTLLADSSKVGKVAFARAGGVEELDVLITDTGADRSFVKRVEKLGVRVIRA